MPALQTRYSAYMQPALEGDIATTLNDDNCETRTCETSAGIAFARAVSEGSNARGCVLGGSNFIGISISDKTLVNAYGDLYCPGNNVAIFLKGDVWVRPVAAVTHGVIASYDAVTGQFNPASGGIELYGSRYVTSAGAGQVALLRLIGQTDGTGDEGDTGPDWLPEGAISFADFQSGHYYAGGVVVTDPNEIFAGDFDAGTFDEADITSEGLLVASKPNFTGSLLADILNSGGSTTVFQINQTNPAAQCWIGIDSAESEDFNHELTIVSRDDLSGPSYFYDDASQIDCSGNLSIHGVRNKVAGTFAPDRLSISVNGATAETTPVGEGAYANIACAEILGAYHALEWIAVYPAKDDSELPGLSAP